MNLNEEQQKLKHIYHGITSNTENIFKNSKYIKSLEEDIHTFLSFTQEIPHIVVSRSTPGSPVNIARFQHCNMDVRNSYASDDINTEPIKASRKISNSETVLDNNLNRVQPKLQRLNSGDTPKLSSWRMNRQSSLCSISSICSLDTNCMSDYSDFDLDESASSLSNGDDTPTKKESMWVKLRKAVRWSPFMQNYKKQYPWIQLAGHAGGFKSGEQGTILKKASKAEIECLQKLMKDSMSPYVPEFKMIVNEDEHDFIQMQDLLQDFDHPSFVMDCKMGTRTYLEEEVNKVGKPRKDLFLKMIAVDPSEPTDYENETRSCTKPRYMQWREQLSSTATLGFRIEGIKRGENNPDKDFKKIKTEEDIASVFNRFVGNSKNLRDKYIQRLKVIKASLSSSNFFKTHEVIGSSLLFIHDAKGLCGVWLIDFGKTMPLKNGTDINHYSDWMLGNHEDGYLTGLDNMINIWTNMDCEKT